MEVTNSGNSTKGLPIRLPPRLGSTSPEVCRLHSKAIVPLRIETAKCKNCICQLSIRTLRSPLLAYNEGMSSSNVLVVPATAEASPYAGFHAAQMAWKPGVIKSGAMFAAAFPGCEDTFSVHFASESSMESSARKASLEAEARYYAAKVKASFSSISSSREESQSASMVIRFLRQYGAEYRILSPTDLDGAKEVFASQKVTFKDVYGTHYVAGRIRGHAVDLSVSFRTRTSEQAKDLVRKVGAAARFARVGASFNAEFSEQLKSFSRSKEFTLNYATTGKPLESANIPTPNDDPEVWFTKVIKHLGSLSLDDQSNDSLSAWTSAYIMFPYEFLDLEGDIAVEQLKELYLALLECELDIEQLEEICADLDSNGKPVPLWYRRHPYILESKYPGYTSTLNEARGAMSAINKAMSAISNSEEDSTDKVNKAKKAVGKLRTSFERPKVVAFRLSDAEAKKRMIQQGVPPSGTGLNWLRIGVMGGHFHRVRIRPNRLYHESEGWPPPGTIDNEFAVGPSFTDLDSSKSDETNFALLKGNEVPGETGMSSENLFAEGKVWFDCTASRTKPIIGGEAVHVELIDLRARVVADTWVWF